MYKHRTNGKDKQIEMPLASAFILNKQGDIVHTNRAMDFSIDGNGFFAIQTEKGRMFSRAGRFYVNSEGILVNLDNFPVLAQDGTQITVGSSSNISVSESGIISAGDEQVAEIGVFALDGNLTKSFLGYISTDGTVGILESPKIIQGALERSNIDKTEAMLTLNESNSRLAFVNKPELHLSF